MWNMEERKKGAKKRCDQMVREIKTRWKIRSNAVVMENDT